MRRLFIFFALCISSVYAKDEAMNICYASDEGYAIPTCVSIASILANCPSENKLNILVVDTGLSEKSKKAIENLKKIRDFKLEFRKFDMERLKIFDVGEWSPAIRIKLYMNELFPTAEKAMWVNGNIIFRKNIKQLYDVDLTGKYFAATAEQHCYDSLVMYNLTTMNQDRIFKKMIDYILLYQRTLQALAGELALNMFNGGFAVYSMYRQIVPIHRHDYYYYKAVSPTAYYFGHKYGVGPWKNPRFLYPEIAIETYDEWHKYCDMTDYKGLNDRLATKCAVLDILAYCTSRINCLWEYRYRRHFLKIELKCLGMLLKIINFINGEKDDA